MSSNHDENLEIAATFTMSEMSGSQEILDIHFFEKMLL